MHRFGRRPTEASEAPAAIVVLGAKVLDDGAPSPALVARVEGALALPRRPDTLVLFSGGGTTITEAQVAFRLACARGLPAAQGVLEEQSRSTFDNARFSAALLRARGLDRAVVVTDDFHAYRAVAQFRRAGVTVISAPVRRSLSPSARLGWTLREVAAVLRRPWLLH